ncbi:MAG: hypothetical protein ACREAF_02190 [Nitrosopumilaceae archaeon]
MGNNNRPAQGSNWRSLQERGIHSSAFRGYYMYAQIPSTSAGKRPDYYGISKTNPKDKIVGDSKNVAVLTKQHVDQVKDYKGYPYSAQKGVIIVRLTTKVPPEIEEYANKSNIRIVKMSAKEEAEEKSFWDWFK